MIDDGPMDLKDEIMSRTRYLIRTRGYESMRGGFIGSRSFDVDDILTMITPDNAISVMIELPTQMRFAFLMTEDGSLVTYIHDLVDYAVNKMRDLMVLDDLADV